jgi:hypothetical protein
VAGAEHPKIVGDRTTLAVMAALYEIGFGLYVPFGENTRCDLIIERDGELSRVQIKTVRLRRGTVQFNVCSTYGHHPHPKVLKRTYDGEIDFFAVHCRETGAVYLIPIDDVNLRSYATLRIEPSRNSQRQRIRWAAPYEIASAVITGPRAPSGA